MLKNNPQEYDKHIRDSIEIDNTEMTQTDLYFLNGLIRELKPKKILEVGVAAGNSSALILNAIKDFEHSKLYSIDYNKMHFALKDKEVGFIVKEKYPHLMDKYTLYTGGLSCNFLDEIGKDIDFVLLDTAHSNPGEILDFIMILPYLKKNATIVIHDILFHFLRDLLNESYTCGILFSAIKSNFKIISKDPKYDNMGNIGALIIDDDIYNHVYDYFHLLTLHWKYSISEKDKKDIINHLSKYYSKEYINLFNKIYDKYNNKAKYSNVTNMYNCLYDYDTMDDIDTNNKLVLILKHLEQLINIAISKIDMLFNIFVWFIPLKNTRNNFREKYRQTDRQTDRQNHIVAYYIYTKNKKITTYVAI